MKRQRIHVLCYAALLLLAAVALLFACCGSTETAGEASVRVSVQGEYRIGDGPWQPLTQDTHIPATNEDVTLRGQLLRVFPDGEVLGPMPQGGRIAMYLDHIGGEVYIDGQLTHIFETEHPHSGESACTRQWIVYEYTGTENDTVDIVLRNPHSFGNSLAPEEFLNSLHMYIAQGYEERMLDRGTTERTVGFTVIVSAVFLMGIAAFSTTMGMEQNEFMWPMGFALLFAGGYFVLNAPNSDIWSGSALLSSNASQLCIMLYVAFLLDMIAKLLPDHLQRTTRWTVYGAWAVAALLMAASLWPGVRLYDLLLPWALSQGLAALILLVCGLLSIRLMNRLKLLVLLPFLLVLAAFLSDILGMGMGWWRGIPASKIVFAVLFFIVLVTVMRIISSNIRAASREKELQTSLEQSKTAIMLSQIQPHFLYNSLGAIRGLCREDPEEAREALSTFISYLRGNMDSLQSEHPIHFMKELAHIEAYLELEKLRFGDAMRVVYDIRDSDFFLPSLTVQPLVENAVKHGICATEDGGTITLHTRRENGEIIITISDDGVGFAPDAVTGPEHVGIPNVRHRLQHMAGGRLQIESEPGKGTVVTVRLPV